MVTTMTQEELTAFYAKLAELVEQSTEQEVREYINHYYPRLPDNVREEILFNTFLDAVDEQRKGEVFIEQIQKEGLEAVDALEELKADIEEEIQKEEAKEKPGNP